MKTLLNGKWRLSFKDNISDDRGEITATVPGNVELDLAEAGYLPKDLLKGMNITLAEKYETYDFVYEREFDCPDPSRAYRMTFEGVDTLAEYYVNGEKFGSSDNMLVEHTFILPKLKAKKNTLTVRISSVYMASLDKKYSARMLNAWRRYETINFRRAAHTYGWDIMPRAVSAGIWKNVILEDIPEYEITQLYFIPATVSTETARIKAVIQLDSVVPFRASDGYKVVFEGKCEDSVFSCERRMTFKAMCLEFDVEAPKLWNTVGFGKPYLYDVKVTVYKGGSIVTSVDTTLGIRTIELIRTGETDGVNGCFKFIVNGNEIFVRGTNWVPMSPYHSQDEARLPRALEALSDIGCNMVRCWGGNVYENDIFYDYCDRHGIMVWQDFSFGCASYSKEPEYLDAIREEAVKVIKRLRSHACLALWSGDNENDALLYTVGVEPSTNIITRRVLPEVIDEQDGAHPYLPSSPYCKTISSYRDKRLPEDHRWGSRDFFKSDFYTNFSAHFVSEMGYHGAVSKESALKFIDESELNNRHGEQWILHSTDQDGDDYRVHLMEKQIGFMFGTVPDNYDEFAEASLMVQSEAYKHFIENMRVKKGVKSGIIWWNLIDGWPQFADSMMDYYYDKKPAYYTVKRSQKPFAMMIATGDNSRHFLSAVNDTDARCDFTYEVTDGDTGEEIISGRGFVPANGVKKLCDIPEQWSKQRLLLIKWETSDGENGFNYFVTGYPEYDVDDYKRWYKIISSVESR